jgi:lipopolysaccharide transport system ATP-binding protein
MNFLNNATVFLPELERRKIPFLFTLYPGGGFGLNDPESDSKLESVLSSPQLRGVIVTQPVTLDYLAGRIDPKIVHEINGVTINPKYFAELNGVPVLPKAGAARICFVADRYMERGANKGYPEFIAAASVLAREFPNLTFAIVGGFTPNDIPLDPAIASRFRFHGRLTTDQLRIFFQTQHIIISPNRPFLVSPGNFDGFPTGACVEAALCGVTVVGSDVLNLNRAYVDGKDIVICDPAPEAIADRVGHLVIARERVAAMGAAGRATTRRAYDPQVQLGRRVALIGSLSRRHTGR